MKIYTRTGDGGETSLIGGGRVLKNHPRLEAYGTLDELNSVLGILRLHVTDDFEPDKRLEDIQYDLFTLGAVLADPKASTDTPERPLKCSIKNMEDDIDRLSANAPKLTSFVLPSGNATAAHSHHARTVCRRAERYVIPLCLEGNAPMWVAAYLNRLSDWLFLKAVNS